MSHRTWPLSCRCLVQLCLRLNDGDLLLFRDISVDWWNRFLSKLCLWPHTPWLRNSLSCLFVLSKALQRWQRCHPSLFPLSLRAGVQIHPTKANIWLRCLNQEPGPLCSAERQPSPKGCSNGSSVLAAWALCFYTFSLDRGVLLCLYFSWLLAELLVGWLCLILHLLFHTYLQLMMSQPMAGGYYGSLYMWEDANYKETKEAFGNAMLKLGVIQTFWRSWDF